ncbi:serine/threonine protein kinase [Candidatus Sumerlaeota bacterium]|nr:serine/threonine protein kinase [Candidatus Sumerlaeota bacterium]
MALLKKIESKAMVGRYELRGEIGKGAMGAVFRAYDPHLDREVAIKIVSLPQSLTENQRDFMVESLLKEGRLAARLNNRGIVQVYDLGEHEDHPYIVLELLEGKPLNEILRAQKRLPFDQVIHVMLSVLYSMAYAHEEGVMHLDLKPANVMVQNDGQVRLMDFGIARSVRDFPSEPTKEVIGTPAYMSPEQIMGHPLDARSDVFSLGIMFFQLLAGQLPFKANELKQLKRSILTDPHPDLRTLAPDLDTRFFELIDCALQKAPEKRFANAREMARMLESIIRRNRRRDDFTEGALLYWSGPSVAILKRRGRRGGPDLVMMLDEDGMLKAQNIALYAHDVQHIGQLPGGALQDLKPGAFWSRRAIAASLFDPHNEDLLPNSPSAQVFDILRGKSMD